MKEQFLNINKTYHCHLPPSLRAGPHPPPPTRFLQATGKYHPYNSDLNYFSHHPIRFCGCYTCGQREHNWTDNYPLNSSSQFNKRGFFRELWTHKPQYKRASMNLVNQQNSFQNTRYQFNQYNQNKHFNINHLNKNQFNRNQINQ